MHRSSLSQARGGANSRELPRVTQVQGWDEVRVEDLVPPAPASSTARVVSSQRGVIRLFDAHEITRFWAHEKYTLFWFEGSEYMTEESLGTLEERLSELGFTRIHRAELVRVDAVRALRMEDGICQVELSDGQQARVSRRCLGLLKRALGLA